MNKERWQRLTIREKIGHITSEFTRARNWEIKRDANSRAAALERALELIEATLEDCKSSSRREFSRLREVTADCFAQTNIYDVTLGDLERYGMSHLVA